MLTILGIIVGIIWGAISGIISCLFGLWNRGAADSILGTLRAGARRSILDGTALDPVRGRRRSRVAADPGADRAARAALIVALIPFVAVAVALLFGRR